MLVVELVQEHGGHLPKVPAGVHQVNEVAKESLDDVPLRQYVPGFGVVGVERFGPHRIHGHPPQICAQMCASPASRLATRRTGIRAI